MTGFSVEQKLADLGIVGCSRKKLPVPAPAWLLYSASPQFSLCFQLATKECGEVMVMSGKWGLVCSDRIIEPYDEMLSEGGCFDRFSGTICKAAEGRSVRVYAAGLYRQLLLRLLPSAVDALPGSLFQRAKSAGRLGRLKPHTWPMQWILSWVWEQRNEGLEVKVLSQRLREKYGNSPTVEAQLERACKCMLHEVRGGRIWRKGLDPTGKDEK